MRSNKSSATDVVRSYFASFADGDADRIASHVTTDFVNVHTAALGSGCSGRAEYRTRLDGFLTDMVDLSYEIEELVADGDQVAVFYRMTGRWQGDHSFSIRGAQLLTVADGSISRRVDYWDSAAFLLQVDPTAANALGAFGFG